MTKFDCALHSVVRISILIDSTPSDFFSIAFVD
jgi:hypothetical protein